MRTSIHAMTIFVRVAESESLAAAARALLIDPAVVSRAIKSLEEELGTLLFARSTRVVKLTRDGSLFHRDCLQVLKRFDTAMRRFRAPSAQPVGQLRVGIAPSLSRRMLLRALPSFRIKYPQIQLVCLGVSELAQVGDEGIDVLLRPRGL